MFDSAQATFEREGKADSMRITDLETKGRKDKVQSDQLAKSKTAVDIRVTELEAQVRTDKTQIEELIQRQILTAKFIVELESQLKDETASVLSLQTKSVHITASKEPSEALLKMSDEKIKVSDEKIHDLTTQLRLKDIELSNMKLMLDDAESENNMKEKENRNNLYHLNEEREGKDLLEASQAELLSKVGELEAQRNKLRAKAAHARFGSRQGLSDPDKQTSMTGAQVCG